MLVFFSKKLIAIYSSLLPTINKVQINKYASSLAIKKSPDKQSNALKRSVNNRPKAPPLSTLFFYFLVRVIKQCCAL